MGIGLMPWDSKMYNILKEQDHLYTLLSRGHTGSEARVVGSIVDFMFAPEDHQAVIDKVRFCGTVWRCGAVLCGAVRQCAMSYCIESRAVACGGATAVVQLVVLGVFGLSRLVAVLPGCRDAVVGIASAMRPP